MKKLIIILVFVASSTTSITGFSQVDINLIINYFAEQEHLVPDLEPFNQQIVPVDKGHKFPGISIYDFKYETPPITRSHRVAVLGNEVYIFPQDLNQLIVDAGINVNNKKEAIAVFLDIMQDPDDDIGEIVESGIQHEVITFEYSVRVWKKENGIDAIWLFSFVEEWPLIFREEIIGVFSGDFKSNEDVIIPGKGQVNYFSIFPPFDKKESRAADVNITNHLGKRINNTYLSDLNENNVVVQENQEATSVERRTVNINLSGWGDNQRVRLSIYLPDQTPITPIFVDTLTTNAEGNASTTLPFAADINTGRYYMFGQRLTGLAISQATAFFVYRTRTGELPSEETYKYRISYGNQFTNYNQDSINNIVDQKIAILTNVYETVVNQWGFPSPRTIDGDEYMDQYLGFLTKYYASRSHCPDVKFLWFFGGIPALKHFVDNYDYNNIEEFMHAADCHEFLHSSQYTYPKIFCNWTSATGNTRHNNYIIEGQARFFQTVYLNSVYPGDNPEFRPNSMYQHQSERYIKGKASGSLDTIPGIQKSLLLQSYDYAIFWRFLYELNTFDKSEQEKLNLLREVLSAVSGFNPLTGGVRAFNSALQASGGNFPSFIEAKKFFATAIYLNDCKYGYWNPCPSDAFYPKPPIKSTGSIDQPCQKLEYNGLIENSFGIDYHEYTLSADTIIKFVFDCDPLKNTPGYFHVSLICFKNDDLVEQHLRDISKGTFSLEVDPEQVDKVAVVVLRLDTDENNTTKRDYKFEFIIDKLPLEIVDINDVTCYKKKDGSATVEATEGTPPYTYLWSNGQTGPTATNLDEGTYYVVAEDAEGCHGVIDVKIEQPRKLSLRISGGNVIIPVCSNLNENPTITLLASATNGTPPYSYSWLDGTTTVARNGIFTCTVTDANGCTATARAYVLFVRTVCSYDPNDITGPFGYSEEHWVSVNDEMPYAIRFENDPDFASAPAQTVLIDLPIDDNLNMYDFRLGSFGFGDYEFEVPPNKTTHTERIDVRDSLGLFVDITAGINIITKKAFWLFESIDPLTGFAPQDANAGFLLVNDSLGRGEGFANFTIKPKITTQTGDSIQAQAFIYFDDNASVDTNIWQNKVDAIPPTSNIAEVEEMEDGTYNISFAGQDDTNGSGLAGFQLYVAEGGGEYNLYGEVGLDAMINLKPTGAVSFSMFSRARDNVGNLEPMKEVPDTILTFIVASAGNDSQICQGDVFQSEGAFTNAPYYYWTGGDGLFDDEFDLNPVYTPGENDIDAGEVTLCLNSSISGDHPPSATCLLLTINQLPDVTCPDYLAVCCTAEPIALALGSPEGGIYLGAGVYFDETEDGYFFAPSCDQIGETAISYTYTDLNGCQRACTFIVEVFTSPVVTGSDYIVCADYNEFSFADDFNPPEGTFYPESFLEEGMSPGIHEFTYTVVNGPCVTSLPFSVTVNPLPDISCTQNIEIPCNNEPYQLTHCSPADGVYVGQGVSFDPVSEKYVFTPSCVEIGEYEITYQFTDGNNCVNQDIFTISVTCPSDIAVIPEFDQVDEICDGDYLDVLPANSLNGITGTWHPAVDNSQTTEYTFTPDSNLCATNATMTIVVNPYPGEAGQISGQVEVCIEQANVEYAIDAIEHATEYAWSLPEGATGSSITNSILVSFPQGAISGNLAVVGLNDCGEGATSTLEVTVIYPPEDAGTITGLDIVCQGQDGALYSLPSIENATSYVWSLPQGATGSSNTNSIMLDFSNNATSGNLTVKGVNDCFDGSVSSLEITVDPLPSEAGIITGEDEVCQGQQEVMFQVDEIDHATSYVWTLPSGATGTSNSNSILVDFGTNATSGFISVKGVNDCGESNISSLSVTVNPLPVEAGIIDGENTVCAGQESIVYSISPLDHATSYVWSLPNGATGSSNTNEIAVDFAADATSGNITVKGTNDCGEGEPSSLFIEVIHQPAAASEITGSQSVCQGQADVLYSVPPIEHTTEYQWTLPEGATGTSASNTILVTFGMDAATGVISVKGSNTCFEGESSSFEIAVNPLPLAAGTIDGESIVCQGLADVVYSVPEVENATSYNWALPPGATGTSTTNTILVSFETSASTGNITVRGQNDCGFGDISTLEVQVNPKPEKPTITLLANHVLRSNATDGNQWYNQDGMIPDAIDQEYQVIENDEYYVIVTLLDCTSDPSETLVINNVGIEIFDGKITLKAYPNPFNDELILEVYGSNEQLEFDILNSTGQFVTTGSFVGNTRINTAGFAAGVYMVKLSNGKSFEFIKVIKAN